MQIVKTDNGNEMLGHIDWLSISIPLTQMYTSIIKDETGTVKRMYEARDRKMFNLMDSFGDMVESGGRAPFNRSYHSSKGGFTYYETDKKPYCLVEFTGKGCTNLYRVGWMDSILKDWHDRVTRLDIAVDMVTDIRPTLFAKGKGEHGKFKSESVVVSESGETVYIGSKSSNRYLRVYRYNEPHPRSNILRSEFVLRDDYGKQAAQQISMGVSLNEIIKGLYHSFGWTDLSDIITGKRVLLTSTPKEVHQGKRERWLLTQVLPALREMGEGGNVEFFKYFQKLIDEIQQGS